MLFGAGLIISTGTLAGCSRQAKEAEPVVTVQSAAVRQATLLHTIQSEAILFAIHQAALTPKVSAPIRTFYVNRGNHVKAGQLLAVLENRDLSASAEESKGAYEQAQASYTTTTAANLPEEVRKAQLEEQNAQANLAAEEKVYDSRQKLFQEGALPRKELDQSLVALTEARSQYAIAKQHLDGLQRIGRSQEIKSAQGQLQAARGHYLGAAAQLSYSEIRSPIAGVVTDRPLYPGEMAAAGMPILTIMDTSRVIAKAHIPQPDAALLKLGDAASLLAPGEAEAMPGKVTVISPALDPNSTTVEVWVQAKNPQERLKPGTTVKVSIVAQVIPNALAIPQQALLTDPDGGTSVMVAGADGRAHHREVKAGVREGDQVQIAEGLHPGEQVITVGAYGLEDKTRIKVESASEETPQPQKQPRKTGDSDERGGS
jgi:HlyD family secretion protein